MGGGQIFLKTFRASLFNEDQSNNTYGMGGWDCQLSVQDAVFCQLSSLEAAIYLSQLLTLCCKLHFDLTKC
jgi:hypothetical protein